MGVLRTKSIEQSIRDTEESEHKLKKDLSALDLTVFGIGVIVGTGIFVLTGIAAATKAGPAVSLSFVLAGVACALAAGAIVLILTGVAIVGVKLSSRFNAVMVTIKLAVVALFIGAGVVKISTANWSPFIPPPAEAPKAANAVEAGRPLIEVLFGLQPLAYGWLGIGFGAAIVFFAFIGFDVVATTAEETRKPQRDMPTGSAGRADHGHRHALGDLADHRRDRGPHRHLRAPDDPGRHGQHRHPVRLRAGVDRSHRAAPHRARPAQGLPHPGRPAGVVYFLYGYRHSRLAIQRESRPASRR